MDIRRTDERAASAVREVIRRSDDQALIARLTRLLILAGDLDEAVETADRLLTGPPFADAAATADARAARGAANTRRGRYAEAQDDLELAREVLGDDVIVTPNLVLAHLRQGVAQYRSSQFAEAVRHLERAVELDPDDPESRSWLGEVLRVQHRWAEALVHLDAARDATRRGSDADRAWTLATRGQVLIALGRPDAAEDDLREAVRLDPTLGFAHCELGDLLRLSGRDEAAVGVLRNAVDLIPGYAPAWASLGVSLVESDRYADALRAVECSLELRPGHPWTLFSRGVILAECDELPAAFASMTAVMGAVTDDTGWARTAYAFVVELLGKPLAEIATAYERVLEQDAWSTCARTRLADIRLLQGKIDEAKSGWRDVTSGMFRHGWDFRVPTARSLNSPYAATAHPLTDNERADIGWCHMRLGQHDLAAAHIGAAAASDVSRIGNCFDLGLNFLLWGRPGSAVDMYSDAIDRVHQVTEAGRQRFLLRLARYDLDVISQDPRGVGWDHSTVSALQVRLQEAVPADTSTRVVP